MHSGERGKEGRGTFLKGEKGGEGGLLHALRRDLEEKEGGGGLQKEERGEHLDASASAPPTQGKSRDRQKENKERRLPLVRR